MELLPRIPEELIETAASLDLLTLLAEQCRPYIMHGPEYRHTTAHDEFDLTNCFQPTYVTLIASCNPQCQVNSLYIQCTGVVTHIDEIQGISGVSDLLIMIFSEQQNKSISKV